MISEKGFQNAVYSFDMGQNDIATPLNANSSYSQVIETTPAILSRIEDAILARLSFVYFQILSSPQLMFTNV